MKDEEDKLEGRTWRYIVVAILAFGLPIVLGAGFVWLLTVIPAGGNEPLPPLAVLIAGVAVVIALSSIVNTALGLLVANENIFPYSGEPVQMAHSLYQSFFLQSQTLLAILLLAVVSVLLVAKTIQPAEGLPIMTGATGFALGKGFTRDKGAEKE